MFVNLRDPKASAIRLGYSGLSPISSISAYADWHSQLCSLYSLVCDTIIVEYPLMFYMYMFPALLKYMWVLLWFLSAIHCMGVRHVRLTNRYYGWTCKLTGLICYAPYADVLIYSNCMYFFHIIKIFWYCSSHYDMCSCFWLHWMQVHAGAVIPLLQRVQLHRGPVSTVKLRSPLTSFLLSIMLYGNAWARELHG